RRRGQSGHGSAERPPPVAPTHRSSSAPDPVPPRDRPPRRDGNVRRKAGNNWPSTAPKQAIQRARPHHLSVLPIFFYSTRKMSPDQKSPSGASIHGLIQSGYTRNEPKNSERKKGHDACPDPDFPRCRVASGMPTGQQTSGQ